MGWISNGDKPALAVEVAYLSVGCGNSILDEACIGQLVQNAI
jgi:hypothetical protein